MNLSILRQLFPIIFRVLFDEALPLGRDVVFGENGIDGTLTNAEATIDAMIGIDVQLFRGGKAGFILGWMDDIDRTNCHAGRILNSYAGLCDYERHHLLLWPVCTGQGQA